MSTTRVPGSGRCVATVFTAKPPTEPVTCQANPASWIIPFAKTNAWPWTSGTTRTCGAVAAVVAVT